MKELGTAEEDSGTGGCQPKGLGDFLQGGVTGGADIWVGDMGDDLLNRTSPGKPPTRGRKANNREAEKNMGGGGMLIPTAGGSNGGGGI